MKKYFNVLEVKRSLKTSIVSLASLDIAYQHMALHI